MADLDTRFDEAVAASKTLPEAPGQDDMLRLYALFKQANEGDVTGKRPDAARLSAERTPPCRTAFSPLPPSPRWLLPPPRWPTMCSTSLSTTLR